MKTLLKDKISMLANKEVILILSYYRSKDKIRKGWIAKGRVVGRR